MFSCWVALTQVSTLTRCYMVDFAEESVKEALRRYNDNPVCFSADFCVADCKKVVALSRLGGWCYPSLLLVWDPRIPFLSSQVRLIDSIPRHFRTSFNVVSCQFCAHYGFDSEPAGWSLDLPHPTWCAPLICDWSGVCGLLYGHPVC